MPNQENFRSELVSQKTFASRIVRFPEEGVLLEEIPGSFGYDKDDNVEIHFYTVQANTLLLSTTAVLSDENVFKFHIVEYDDGSIQTYLRIDFTQLFELKNLILLPGDYRMVLNFFSDEIGSYFNRKLYIQEVSPTRTEIQLGFVDNISSVLIDTNQKLLDEFVLPSFDKITAISVANLLLKAAFADDDPFVGITFGTMFTDNILDRMARANVTQNAKQDMEIFLSNVFKSVKEKIVMIDDERIQQKELVAFIDEAVKTHLSDLQTKLHNKIRVL